MSLYCLKWHSCPHLVHTFIVFPTIMPRAKRRKTHDDKSNNDVTLNNNNNRRTDLLSLPLELLLHILTYTNNVLDWLCVGITCRTLYCNLCCNEAIWNAATEINLPLFARCNMTRTTDTPHIHPHAHTHPRTRKCTHTRSSM